MTNNTKLRDVLKQCPNDGYNLWPNKDKNNTAAQRLSTESAIKVRVNPKFKLSSEERFFTIGSCFARNIERKLLECKAEILSNDISIPQEWVAHPQAKNSDILNKFNTHSIYNEIHRTLCPEKYTDMGLINVKNDKWYDPQTSYTAVISKDKCLEMRNRIETLYNNLSNSTTVIMTLGMTESWIDDETGLFINGLPPPEVIKHQKDRFSFFNASVPMVEDSLAKTIELLKEKCTSSIKIIITISPVPLRRTFTQNDIITANTFSKSTLRVAAQNIADWYSFVDYYPSYEMVMNSPRQSSWQEDTIHVADDLVGMITSCFIEKYIG